MKTESELLKNPVYKAVKNYLHNKIGINKEYVEKLASTYLEKAIDKAIMDKLSSGWIERLIVSRVGEIITGEKRIQDMMLEWKN